MKQWIDCILLLTSKGLAKESIELLCKQFAIPKEKYIPFTDDEV